jgi:hypothetical protein
MTSVSLLASVHRDLVSYEENSDAVKWTTNQRSNQANRANACALYGNGSRL